MKRLIFILSVLLFAVTGKAQKLVPDVHDLGRVKLYNNPTLIFTFTNTSSQPVMFMPTPYMLNLEVDLPKGYIKPGETVKIKVRYYTEDFGQIRVHQPIYINTSDEPLYINITGRIISFHPNALTVCPNMNKSASDLRIEQSGSPTITIYDKQTGQTISGADLLFTGRANKYLIENARNPMVTLEKFPTGLYEVVVSKHGYHTAEETIYINQGGGHFIIELEPIHSDDDPSEQTTDEQLDQDKDTIGFIDTDVFVFRRKQEPAHDTLSDKQEDEEEEEIVIVEEDEDEFFVIGDTTTSEDHGIDRIRQMVREKYADHKIIERDVVVIEEDTVPATEEVIASTTETTETKEPGVEEEKPVEVVPDFDDKGQLSKKYVQNNIVFLIDVSSSMRDPEKLPMLKESMKNMVSVLRSNDFVTIITYASSTHVLLSSVPGDRKEEIYAVIDSLSALGYSRGADGMDMAYNQALRSYITNGNNQVILATDGMFNSDDVTNKDLYKMARTQLDEHDIHLSVVAFGKNKEALSFMTSLSRNGNGSYIRIDPESSENEELVMEIMKNALR